MNSIATALQQAHNAHNLPLTATLLAQAKLELAKESLLLPTNTDSIPNLITARSSPLTLHPIHSLTAPLHRWNPRNRCISLNSERGSYRFRTLLKLVISLLQRYQVILTHPDNSQLQLTHNEIVHYYPIPPMNLLYNPSPYYDYSPRIESLPFILYYNYSLLPSSIPLQLNG